MLSFWCHLLSACHPTEHSRFVRAWLDREKSPGAIEPTFYLSNRSLRIPFKITPHVHCSWLGSTERQGNDLELLHQNFISEAISMNPGTVVHTGTSSVTPMPAGDICIAGISAEVVRTR